MTLPKSLPARPSQDSLRKQAKKLAHDIEAGESAAMARARAQLPKAELPLSHRDAQLVLAREYGFAGWQDLTAEVLKRLGRGLEWAGEQAERAIHDNNMERLKQLLAEYPALLSWGLDHGGLGRAVICYAMDASDPERERMYVRHDVAEFLIDAGATVVPWLTEGMLNSRTKIILQLFARKGLLPRTLKHLAALGDEEGVRALAANHQEEVNEAFRIACAFDQPWIATFLLERAIASTPALGKQIEGWGSRSAFVEYMIQQHAWNPEAQTPWHAFLMHRVKRAIGDGDLNEFTRLLRENPWLIGASNPEFSAELIGQAVWPGRADFIERVLELDPGLMQRKPLPSSRAIEWAFTTGNTHLIPVLTRVWPLPDDLPHAAGNGDFDSVRKWFDESGQPALGDPASHYPWRKPRTGSELHWSPPTVQRVLDIAFAWAVMNHRFEIAEFLLKRGADIDARWASHEPASILHELVFREDYEAMQFLIDRGIDMTITDYRWGGTAQGWAWHAARNEKLTQWLAEQEQQQRKGS